MSPVTIVDVHSMKPKWEAKGLGRSPSTTSYLLSATAPLAALNRHTQPQCAFGTPRSTAHRLELPKLCEELREELASLFHAQSSTGSNLQSTVYGLCLFIQRFLHLYKGQVQGYLVGEEVLFKLSTYFSESQCIS